MIKSDISELKNVEDFLKNVFREFELPMKFFNKVFLCMSEAVVNSIEHGNKHNSDKKVTIKIDVGSKEIKVLIEDEGDGFNFSEIQDPTLSPNILRENGRGIHIIKSLSENIKYNEKGNRIQFKIECK